MYESILPHHHGYLQWPSFNNLNSLGLSCLLTNINHYYGYEALLPYFQKHALLIHASNHHQSLCFSGPE